MKKERKSTMSEEQKFKISKTMWMKNHKDDEDMESVTTDDMERTE